MPAREPDPHGHRRPPGRNRHPVRRSRHVNPSRTVNDRLIGICREQRHAHANVFAGRAIFRGKRTLTSIRTLSFKMNHS